MTTHETTETADAKRYLIRDDGATEEIIEATSMDEALWKAREWAAGGSYDERVVVRVRVVEINDDNEEIGEARRTEVMAGPEPEAPPCVDGSTDDDDHDWQAIYRLVGGCTENPGVHATGGTSMTYRTVCVRCGAYRIEHHAGSQRNPDELPESVEYEDADEASRAYVEEE